MTTQQDLTVAQMFRIAAFVATSGVCVAYGTTDLPRLRAMRAASTAAIRALPIADQLGHIEAGNARAICAGFPPGAQRVYRITAGNRAAVAAGIAAKACTIAALPFAAPVTPALSISLR